MLSGPSIIMVKKPKSTRGTRRTELALARCTIEGFFLELNFFCVTVVQTQCIRETIKVL